MEKEIKSFQKTHYEKMKHRECSQINIGTSTINTKIGIFNFPKGFGRKKIISMLLQDPVENWEKTSSLDHRYIENYYRTSEIIQEKIISVKKINTSILLCDEKNIASWIYQFTKNKISFLYYDQKKILNEDEKTNTVILVSQRLVAFLIQHCFYRLTISRFILYDPELLELDYIPQLYYGFVWIISSEPIYLRSLPSSHFIFRFLPYSLDIKIFNLIQICRDLKIQETLKHLYALPNFTLLKHSCREEMYNILKGVLDDDIYNLLHNGQIHQVMEKLNGTNNIWDYICDKIDMEFKHAKADLENYKNINNKKSEEMIVLKERMSLLEHKKQSLETKMNEYKNNNECIICHCYLKDPVILYCCQNLLCGSCIIKWLQTKNNCPLCRGIIHNDDIIHFKCDDTPTLCDRRGDGPTKFKKLTTRINKVFEIIESYPEETIFFYSDAKEIIETLISYCITNHISYVEISSSNENWKKPCRIMILTDFRNIIGFESLEINHFISFSYLKKFIYKYICSRFYRTGRSKDFHFHSFTSFS